MAVVNVWLFPVLISSYSIFCLLTCASLSAYYHSFPSRWPYLSDFTKEVPAKNAFAVMTNHILLMALIWIYLKHRELISYFLQSSLQHLRTWSTANTAIGFGAIFFMQLSVNFPETKVPHMEYYSNRASLVLFIVYVWLHCLLSSRVADKNISNTKLLVVRLTIAAALSSCAVSMLQLVKTHPSAQYGAIYEWACYLSFCFFLLTDAYEFRNLVFRAPKLVIRGSSTYDEAVFSGETQEEETEDYRQSWLTTQLVR
ncbi:unnamed protein product [Caenorhabditis auriculariae]|uniref:CWH43-like N-terminal domain-containing protein n=1 Tax=Caenorhabditis auriculariae TaxID=2777116 RepID=A0A8S1H7D8_9PELO|nr:unnamed protein product [Caenorhabditis auriculariae]